MGTLAAPPCLAAVDDDLEVAARRAAARGVRSVALVDGEGAFAGFVPVAYFAVAVLLAP